MAQREATGDRSKARAGTLTLIEFGSGFDYRLMRDLVARGLPGGPSGVELPDEEFVEFDDEDELDDLEEGEEELYAAAEVELDAEDEPMYRTSLKGNDIVSVVFALRNWLSKRRGGPGTAELGADPEAGSAIVSLLCGWSATVTHNLAARPLTLAELDRKVQTVDRGVIGETLAEMERTGIVESLPGAGEARWTLTNWGREAVAPLVAAARYERLHPSDFHLPPDVLDIEAAFQMALPLLRLPPDLRGSCRLGVWIPGGAPLMAGATVEAGEGRILSSTPLLDESPENWITGLPLDWCETALDPTVGKLKRGGDEELADALLEALHERLFGERT